MSGRSRSFATPVSASTIRTCLAGKGFFPLSHFETAPWVTFNSRAVADCEPILPIASRSASTSTLVESRTGDGCWRPIEADYSQSHTGSIPISNPNGILNRLRLPAMTVTANRLADAMKQANEDQSSLARAIGITQGAISKILQGKTANSRHLPRIAIYLGVSLPWLLGETEDPEPNAAPRPPAAQQVVMMGVLLPPARALARMFEALLAGIDPQLPRAEQALLLAERLPIGLSQLRDLLPDSVSPVRQERSDVAATPATPHPELAR